MITLSRWWGAAALVGLLFTPLAQASLFEDDEARRAILDLRQKFEESNEKLRVRQTENERTQEEVNQLKRSLLELNNQLELLRTDNAKLRGQGEQLGRDVTELQRQVKDLQQGVDARMSKLEPQKVSVDGNEFAADPDEKRLYDDAMGVLRGGDFSAAAMALSAFQKRYPASGYADSVLFWLGNAYYGKRDYKEAIASFRSLLSKAPNHPRAPEALLSVANCQLELKDAKGARKTLGDLIKAYPKSEAAQAGRERLASLK